MASVFFIQQNFTVGDIVGNEKRLLNGAQAAVVAGAAVALAPELALTGYPVEDLLYHPTFHTAISDALHRIVASAPPELALVIGLPWQEKNQHYNAGVLIRGGRIEGVYKKSVLPNDSVFDDYRYFTVADNQPLLFTAGGESYTLQICQDIWTDEQAQRVAATGAKNTLVINGSPFFVGKQAQRIAIAASFARTSGSRLFYVNMVGGQDELVYDGASFVVDADGSLQAQLPAFTATNTVATTVVPYPDDDQAAYEALAIGLSDYVHKNGFTDGIVLGLSGGVDSALVATLAVDALSAEQVTAIMIPSPYTSAMSLKDAAQLASNLGINYWQMPLTQAVNAVHDTIRPHLKECDNDVTLENIQARLRGTLLMAISNNRHWLLLATGNKSEIASGYATLYGDMNGGFAPIKDVLKTQVWDLCRYRNRLAGYPLIPTRIIERPPSAELRVDQTDQDTLPPYVDLDAMLKDHLQQLPYPLMVAKHDKTLIEPFYQRLASSEHKRRQAAIGTKISHRAFGRDWRMPITNHFHHA